MNARFMQAAIISLLVFTASGKAQDQDYETQMKRTVSDVAAAIKKAGKKKVATVDFADLQGNVSELGRFLSEEMSVGLVLAQDSSFKVVDRTHLKRIMDEHKLTMSGLLDPENTKKLGQFSGADALIFGTYTDLINDLVLSVKIVSTESAQVEGAARVKILKSPDMRKLLSEEIATEEDKEQDPKTKKDRSKSRLSQEFDRMRVTLQSLRTTEDGEIVAMLIITNTTDNAPEGREDCWGGKIAIAMNSDTTGKITPRRDSFGAGPHAKWDGGTGRKDRTVINAAAALLDNKGNKYALVRSTGVSFARDINDWTNIAPSQEARISLEFKVANPKKLRGAELVIQIDLLSCFCTAGWGNVKLKGSNNVYLEGVRLQGSGNADQ